MQRDVAGAAHLHSCFARFTLLPSPRKLSPMTKINTKSKAITLRNPQPGDMGWVVQQHGEIYAREYGWNAEFEALVLDIIAKLLRRIVRYIYRNPAPFTL